MLSRLFDQGLATALCELSRVAPRGRAHHCMHGADDEAVHRLFVAMQPGSYIQPHRHLDPLKTESLVVLQGALGFIEFDGSGTVIARSVLGKGGPGMGIDIPPGCWHGIVALDADTLFFETKAGPLPRIDGSGTCGLGSAGGESGGGQGIAAAAEPFQRLNGTTLLSTTLVLAEWGFSCGVMAPR
jgi:cupin fold WbuC family metalloprotein